MATKHLLIIKKKCINEIIHLIKKYNIGLDDIIVNYIDKYKNHFTEVEKIKYQRQFNEFNQYNIIFNQFIKESNQKILSTYKIIDDYVLI